VHVVAPLVMPSRFRPSPRRSYAVLSTYPPTPCGIATFAAALAGGIEEHGGEVEVVRLSDGLATADPRVAVELEPRHAPTALDAIRVLNRADVVIAQHEYGIYSGPDGEDVVDLLREVTVPTIVVAHTVLARPTTRQRMVLEAVVDAASAVVVMTDVARQRLSDAFAVEDSKIFVIPHGAAVHAAGPRLALRRGSPLVLTWGLLGPGKGIEWALDAFALLKDLRPRPRYLVAGATHPKVAAIDGEAYREMLMRRSWARGVASMVSFDAGYRSLEDLNALVAQAAVVLLPYDSQDQVTSGVLVDAVAAGRPVVSTAFPHAQELLGSGAGIVVDQRAPVALAAALRRVLTEPGLASSMAAEAARLAPELGWGSVAGRYAELASRLLVGHEAVPA